MTGDGNEDDDRRAFLKTCGRFAAVKTKSDYLVIDNDLKAVASKNGVALLEYNLW